MNREFIRKVFSKTVDQEKALTLASFEPAVLYHLPISDTADTELSLFSMHSKTFRIKRLPKVLLQPFLFG